jgi:hypothetical protein
MGGFFSKLKRQRYESERRRWLAREHLYGLALER